MYASKGPLEEPAIIRGTGRRGDGPAVHPVALTVAGFDPSSGAGITADLKTFAAHGVYGISCITALTVQSTQGVRRVVPIDPAIVTETLQALAADMTVAGIKIGMLGSSGAVGAVATFLAEAKLGRERIVLDPVLRSSSGAALLDEAGLRVMQEQLLPQVGWITPNLDELEVLLSASSPLRTAGPVTREAISEGAARLRETVRLANNLDLSIVVTGGHLDRPDDYYLGAEMGSGDGVWLPGDRVVTPSTHGTGCAFSSALLGQLLSGRSKVDAVRGAKVYVAEALRTAYPVGKGRGPMNHLFRLDARE